jgi:hypothetical protein
VPSAAPPSVRSIAKRGFRKSLLGYNREAVDTAIAARDERLSRLEREASSLAERILDRERRLQAALGRLGEDGEVGLGAGEPPGAIAALGRRLEEVHAQARRQATRIRMRALSDAVQIADRVTELARVRELLEGAGLRRPDEGPDPLSGAAGPGTAAAESVPREDGVFDGRVEVEIGPLRDFAQLSEFEDAANEIGAAGEIKVRRFSGGRATLSIDLGGPVELLRELEERAALDFKVRSLKPDRVVLDVEADEEAAAA